jgi:urease accessory protein
MVMGGALGYAGLPLPYVEQGIGVSVVVMGVAIALGMKLPTAIAMTLVAVFALFHGHAHGSEGAELAAFLPYAAGFVAATALLHMVGIGLALGFDRFGHVAAERMMRSTGAVAAAAGISLLAGWLAV